MATARKAAPRKTAPKAAAEPEIFDPFAGAELPKPFIFRKLNGETAELPHPSLLSTKALIDVQKAIEQLDEASEELDQAIMVITTAFPDGSAEHLLELPPEYMMLTFEAWFGLLGVSVGESDGSQD